MKSLAFTEKIAARSRPDYEKSIALLCDPHHGRRRVGSRAIRSISPAGADKLRRKAGRIVHRLHPEHFDKAVPNPWTGVTLKVKARAK